MTHIAVVSQNLDLALDLRPRAQAVSLAAAGYDVTLVGGTKDPHALRELITPGVDLEIFGMPTEASGPLGQVREQALAFVATGRALVRLARLRRIDVVHSGNPPDSVWLLLGLVALVQRARPRFVFDQHDVAPVLLQEKYGTHGLLGLAHRLSSWLERHSFSSADLVLYTSPEYLTRANALRLTRSPSEIVPNGWSLPVGPARDWRDGRHWLLAYVGSISEQDNVDELIRAVALLPDRKRVRVVVAGAGSGLRQIQELAVSLGVDECFNWLGWVSDRATLGSLVRAADVCVAPETDSEFNRLAALVKIGEYMSAEAAVVAHRLPQTEALAGEAVRYADTMGAAALAAAITSLLQDENGRSELARAGRIQFERHLSWDSVGSTRLVAAYESLLSKDLAGGS